MKKRGTEKFFKISNEEKKKKKFFSMQLFSRLCTTLRKVEKCMVAFVKP